MAAKTPQKAVAVNVAISVTSGVLSGGRTQAVDGGKYITQAKDFLITEDGNQLVAQKA